jgi:hypothetical protein
MVPSTKRRVPVHTAEGDNRAIESDTERRLEYFALHPSKIEARLRDLDKEWDIERAIEMNAAALAFAGVALGAAHDKRWLLLPAAVTAFLFQHAVQGWCPPIPVLRKLGFRTVYEIDEERNALKALRGDFASVSRRSVTAKSRPTAKRRIARAAKRAAAA